MKLLSLFLVLSFFSTPSFAKICGRIATMRGQIEILRVKKGDNPKSEDVVRTAILGQRRMKLKCSDIVVSRASARAKIRFTNKAVLTLGPHSRLELLDYLKRKGDPSQLKLTYGKVRALLSKKDRISRKLPKKGSKPKRKTSRFIIKTPSAVAGVRGTDFYISYNPEKFETEQATITGEVEVEKLQTGEKVLVKPGKQVEVKQLKKVVAEEIKRQLKEGKDIKEIQASVKEFKPLKMAVIKPETKEVIRQTSVIAKDDKDFASRGAVKILGKPNTWKLPPDEVPFDLKDIKEEF